ncbi:AAA family ATPase [Streptomyces mirabilis]|uniref:AAA family ATPase n=1 Tax=Streptomyces mirabilis TaxID=68239 RepID=UPI00331A1B25
MAGERRSHGRWAVKQHSSSSVLLISDPAGIGKTTVLSELCAQAAAMSLRVARSKCDEIEQMRPGAAFLALLRSGLEPLLTADEFARIIRDVDEPLLLADHLEEVAAHGPVLIAIDDVQWIVFSDHTDHMGRLDRLLGQVLGVDLSPSAQPPSDRSR